MNQNWQTEPPTKHPLNNKTRAIGRILFNTLIYLPILIWGIRWYWSGIVNSSNQLGGPSLRLAGPLFVLGAILIIYGVCDIGYSYWKSIQKLMHQPQGHA